MKREPRLERLAAASRTVRRNLDRADTGRLRSLQELLERVLELEVLDRDALHELEELLLP